MASLAELRHELGDCELAARRRCLVGARPEDHGLALATAERELSEPAACRETQRSCRLVGCALLSHGYAAPFFFAFGLDATARGRVASV